MKLDPFDKEKLLDSVNHVRGFIEQLEIQKSCISCVSYDAESYQCGASSAMVVPEEVRAIGCPSWDFLDSIPF